MKNPIRIVVLGMCLVFAFAKAGATTSFLQEFVSHQVKEGETIYSISKAYGITEKQIFKLNPDAKSRVYEGLVLILPSTAQKKDVVQEDVPQDDIKFKTHKVKRKETLYSISKKYKVPEHVIKKYNKELYSQTLRKGAKIRIPVNYKATAIAQEKPAEIITSTVVTVPTYTNYVVQAKETKYGIARKYGMTIAALEALNPTIKTGLKEGETLKVPDVQTATTAVIDETKYSFYEVQKGNTMYSLLRDFDLKADELLTLNPSLDDGLKEGMILKVPKGSAGSIQTQYSQVSITENAGKVSLADSITDYSVKKIAVMLPFGLKRAASDSSNARKDMLKSDRVLRLALDFHSGILMAVEDAEKMGINAVVNVYDTDYAKADGNATNARKVENIINTNDFTNVDVVIGPLLGGNVDRAASILARSNIPLISPMTQRISGGSNVFQSRPSDAILQQKMLDFLKKNGADKNVIIIADASNSKAKSKLKAIFPNAKEVVPRKGDNGMFLYPDDIPNQVDKTKENWVILETDDVPLISNVTTSLNAQLSILSQEQIIENVKITLFTTNKGRAYRSDEIQHTHLMNLNFHFPSIDKEYDATASDFINTYETMYNITPSTEAIRGYDIMMDALLRLGYAQDLYQAAASGVETKYIENKFKYSKKNFNGFYNDAVYIMKYDDNLTLKEVTPAQEEVQD